MADPKDPKEEDKQSLTTEEDKETLSSEEDKVAAAYENISKKLESLRNGKEVDDEDDDSNEETKQRSDGDDSGDELEEWKGPKPMKNPEVPEEDDDDLEIRKVKLKNPENEEAEEEDEIDDKDQGGEDEEATKNKEAADDIPEEKEADEDESGPVKKWKPAQNDPLDEETEAEERKDEEDPEEEEEDDDDGSDEGVKKRSDGEPGEASKDTDSEDLEEEIGGDASERKIAQPDTLDDLTEEGTERQTVKEQEEDDDYFIPNLKGTGQRHSNIGYNTPIESENSSGSYQKSSMDNQGFSSNNDPGNFFSQHSQTQAPKRASKFHLLILVIIGIVVIGFTVYILKGGFGDLNLSTKPSPSPSPVESASPTPTPTPEPDRAQYKLKVLNGSGKTGLAASVSAKLKELGYQTEKTGNATNSAFTQTIVRVKPGLESFIPQIVKDLAPEFDAAGNTSLKDSETVDIEIILGAK